MCVCVSARTFEHLIHIAWTSWKKWKKLNIYFDIDSDVTLCLMVVTAVVVMVATATATTTMTLVDASYFLVKGNPLDTNSTLFSYKDMYK